METITIYSLVELKEQFPSAYDKAIDRIRASMTEIPWSDETMDSLKAAVDACGGSLRDWSIGPYAYSDLSVDVDDEDEDGKAKDHRWMIREVLRPLGYVKANGHADFPGHCKLTGYCVDDDCLEHVFNALKSGDTLTDALKGLADVARQAMEADVEQEQDEDNILELYADRQYTEDGIEV